MSDNGIDGIFDDITPEDFSMESTAFYSFSKPYERFEEFVFDHINTIRFAFSSCDGRMSMMYALTSGDIVRYYSPLNHENVGEFTARISKEAKWFKADAIMVVFRSEEAGVIETPFGDAPDVDDELGLMEASMMGTVEEAIIMFSFSSRWDKRICVMFRIDGNNLGQMLVSPVGQSIKTFEQIIK